MTSSDLFDEMLKTQEFAKVRDLLPLTHDAAIDGAFDGVAALLVHQEKLIGALIEQVDSMRDELEERFDDR